MLNYKIQILGRIQSKELRHFLNYSENDCLMIEACYIELGQIKKKKFLDLDLWRILDGKVPGFLSSIFFCVCQRSSNRFLLPRKCSV